MRSRFLFPYWCRYVGYLLIVAHIPVVMFRNSLGFNPPGTPYGPNLFNSHHLFFMTTTLLMALGLFLVAFAKEKIEDELIWQLRADSLQWAIYINYLLLIVSLIFTSDTQHILFLNLLVPLIFFIVCFRLKIYQNNRLLKKDEHLT